MTGYCERALREKDAYHQASSRGPPEQLRWPYCCPAFTGRPAVSRGAPAQAACSAAALGELTPVESLVYRQTPWFAFLPSVSHALPEAAEQALKPHQQVSMARALSELGAVMLPVCCLLQCRPSAHTRDRLQDAVPCRPVGAARSPANRGRAPAQPPAAGKLSVPVPHQPQPAQPGSLVQQQPERTWLATDRPPLPLLRAPSARAHLATLQRAHEAVVSGDYTLQRPTTPEGLVSYVAAAAPS